MKSTHLRQICGIVLKSDTPTRLPDVDSEPLVDTRITNGEIMSGELLNAGIFLVPLSATRSKWVLKWIAVPPVPRLPHFSYDREHKSHIIMNISY